MGYLIFAFFTLFGVWNMIRGAKKSGTWSYKIFFMALGGAALLFLIVTLPLWVFSDETIKRHPAAFFSLFFAELLAGVAAIVIVARKMSLKMLPQRNQPRGPS